jgi:4-amino-4-deoxy-L-arabinose transferase-like glycosyltransferase
MAIARRSLRLPLIAFGAGLFTSLMMIFVVFRAQHLVANAPDPYRFASMAHSLLQGNGFAGYGSVLDRRGPLYPTFIALVFLVTGEHPVALQIAQAFLVAGICAIAFDMGRRLYNVRTGLIAGLLCAVHPALLRYVADFHLETLLMFLTTVTIWRSVVFLGKPDIRNGVLMGVCAALAALTKPVVLLYPVAFAVACVLREWKSTKESAAPRVEQRFFTRWAPIMAILAALGAVILPWTYRNYRVSGHVVLITTGVGDALVRGQIFSKPDYALLRLPPYTYAENECNVRLQAICAEAGIVCGRDDVETDRALSRAAKSSIAANPLGFVRKFVVQLFTFWYEMTTPTTSLVAGATALVLWILALIGWRRARKEGRLSWPLFLPIFCLNLPLAALLALGRYSVPILPALTTLAAFGADTLLDRYRRQPAPAKAA